MYGTIIFERPERYTGSLRNFKLFGNGREIGRIGNGEQVRVQLPAGRYEIKAKFDFLGSAPFVVDLWPDQTVRLVCRINENGGLFGESAALFGIGHYLEIFAFDPNYSYVAANPRKPFPWGTVVWQSAALVGFLGLAFFGVYFLVEYLAGEDGLDSERSYRLGQASGQLFGFIFGIGILLIFLGANRKRRS